MQRIIPFLVGVSLAFLVGACAPREKLSHHGGTQVDLRIVLKDGRVVEKSFERPADTELTMLADTIGNASGEFTLAMHTSRAQDDIVYESSGTLKEGKFEGEVVTCLISKGARFLVRKATYQDDKMHGPFESFYALNGTKQIQGKFESGIKSGEFRLYYMTGELAMTMNYSDGILNGAFELLDRTGSVVAEGRYLDGSPYSGTFLENLDSLPFDLLEKRTTRLKLQTYQAGQKIAESTITLGSP